ncbi:hypothetical protein HBA55_30935 [Pseudomaricurvus alkylphenolicus]|uniref:hypothetical protein n=1 Tax=Pseudomaricurvus alkylphenolicus TaxID=1306991 RepID=UPI001422F5F5|nr:hypothetical protein [Pseudomaricurvus alkylphenolicus]NIB44057.1 hypothetical protein [Pseudomaricurvus alkylphenolicus]
MNVPRSATLWLTLLMLLLAVVVGTGLMHRIGVTSLNEVRDTVLHWQPFMVVCRWTLLVATALIWRSVYLSQCRQGSLSPTQHKNLLNKRLSNKYRMVIVTLLLMELVIGQRWLFLFLDQRLGVDPWR